MQIDVSRCEYSEVENLRELNRQELNCQIIRDSFLPRGLADPYRILVDGRLAGYGAVANKYDKGRLVEFLHPAANPPSGIADVPRVTRSQQRHAP